MDALQADLDAWMAVYNEQRTHQGRWCFGRTPMQTFLDSAAWAREKQNIAKATQDSTFDRMEAQFIPALITQLDY